MTDTHFRLRYLITLRSSTKKTSPSHRFLTFALSQYFRSILKSAYHDVFQNWIHRLKSCIFFDNGNILRALNEKINNYIDRSKFAFAKERFCKRTLPLPKVVKIGMPYCSVCPSLCVVAEVITRFAMSQKPVTTCISFYRMAL